MEKVLLSICIPTYNRAEHLQTMLRNIVSLKVFSECDEIEYIVLDNASTDNTQEIGERFAREFPSKIKYFRNSTNIEDRNFGKALSLGIGTFLKLSNDTLLHTDSGLRHTLAIIKKYEAEKPILCFERADTEGGEKRYSSLEEFWRARSYSTTWIAEFGTWKSDFTSADDFGRRAETHLTQVDFLLRLMSLKKDAVIVKDSFFTLIPRKRIGTGCVNSSRVFGRDYLDLLAPYVKTGEISESSYNREKWRVFRYLILPNNLITRPDFEFPKDHFVKHLFFHYKWKFYFWAVIPLTILARMAAKVRKIIKL